MGDVFGSVFGGVWGGVLGRQSGDRTGTRRGPRTQPGLRYFHLLLIFQKQWYSKPDGGGDTRSFLQIIKIPNY